MSDKQKSPSKQLGAKSSSPKNRHYKKSKTPPNGRHYSPSSDDESSEDDFPSYRSNWREKSPSTPTDRKSRLEEVDFLLRKARRCLAEIID